MDVIERNVARFEANTDGESSHHLLHLIREMVAGEFLTRYQIQPLKQEDRILPDVAEQVRSLVRARAVLRLLRLLVYFFSFS